MKKFLIKIMVIQKDKKSGYNFLRLNPYHPLSYLILIIGFVVALICFGIIGMWDEFNNPFKWQ